MFESFKELISSAASTSAQRVKNPVLGAFALSWCAFNWKQILYLLFSDEKIIVRINYISDLSNWRVSFLYPAMSTAAICIVLPLINLLIAWLQIKPLDLSDNIEHKKYMVKTERRKQKRKADAELDVIYEQTKTGAEKEIQDMKEEITASKDRMGELTNELENKKNALDDAEKHIKYLERKMESVKTSLEEKTANFYEVAGILEYQTGKNYKDFIQGFPKDDRKIMSERIKYREYDELSDPVSGTESLYSTVA